MPDDTPNHGYSRPDKGASDWDQPLNTNFADLDTDVELRDTGTPSSNNYDPTEGAKYLDTSGGVVYTADGNAWTAAFVLADYDDAADEATFDSTLTVSGDVDFTGSLLGDIGGSITDWSDAAALDASGAIADWSGATVLDTNGAIADWSGAADLDSSGSVTASFVQSLSGGDGISPGSIGDGDTVSVAWDDAGSLDSTGTVDAGRYVSTSSGQVDFAGPAEWENAGETATNTASGSGATVAGGESNEASNLNATVAGGNTNVATGVNSTIGGGENNEASGTATVAGGNSNKATASNTVVSGGANNESRTNGSTVGGGATNVADAQYATVAGGNNNLVTGAYGTIAGGAPQNPPEDSTQNAVYDAYGTIGGGSNNQAGSDDGTANAEYATVPGGRNNTASGAYSTALGRAATADNDGAFVVGDSTSSAVSSDDSDQALFQQSVVSERFIETGSRYYFSDTAMFTVSSVNNNSNDQWSVAIPDVYGNPIWRLTVEDTGTVTVQNGDLNVNGDVNADNKNFVQTVDTDEGEKEVVYTSTEAGEARTEASGVAQLEDGRAEIDLPEHFAWVTSTEEPLVVQVTPHASERVQPQVTERSPDRLVVEDFADADAYEVSYTVKGTRDGYEDKQIVREPATTGSQPAPADD